MFCMRISWLICAFVAVTIATGRTVQHSNTESSLAIPVNEVRPDPAVELGSLLDAGEGAAVTLVSGDTRLLAHRSVLAARSPVLQRLLQDAATGEVAVPDVEGPALRALLAYLYTLQAPQLPTVAPQLLAAAHRYGLPALKADCERQVAAQLTVETAAATAVLAVRHSSDSLKTAAIDYIRAHIFHVIATQGWTDAVNSQPQVMLKVRQLLSQLPPENSSSAPAESGSSPYHATQPHSDYSGHQTPTSAATTTVAQVVTPPDDDNISLLRSSAPAESGSSPYHTTQPHSDYSGHQTPTSPATTTVAQTITHADDNHISFLRSLSAEEKNERLMEAAKQGAVVELGALLAAGANVAATDEEYGGTGLHWAAIRGDEEAARRLLAAGAAVGARDSKYLRTPLHWAVDGGHAATVRLLLAAGAAHGARDENQRTPLHWAAFKGHTEAAAALLAAGADRAALDKWGDTPLDDARAKNHLQLVELLQADSSQGDGTAPK